MAAHVHIGTSGFSYDHWREVFYPHGLAKRRWLALFAERLATVEINSTFYGMPRASTLEKWRDTVGRDFRFTLKANRLITHRHRLAGRAAEVMHEFIETARVMGPKLVMVLVQLPPGLGFDPDRLVAFAQNLPRDMRYAVEFRNPSWYCDQTRDLLTRHDLAFVWHDMAQQPCPEWVCAREAYLRFHGSESRYGGSYAPDRLRATADRIRSLRDQGHDVFVYFNNDEKGHAVNNALELQGYVRGD